MVKTGKGGQVYNKSGTSNDKICQENCRGEVKHKLLKRSGLKQRIPYNTSNIEENNEFSDYPEMANFPKSQDFRTQEMSNKEMKSLEATSQLAIIE
ncbi:hypothetical protein C922_03600 [Plasmodium inui San Antonio 1]|uniref:Uncharacterized protein n=1 Tax=Plasmodium inui San Antonio 1 TaxID=1237626 RepID=W7AKL0_9APIC|nr:hypothetical protein C922_03600 [Plasmodium inui San Antonio 1]EUD65876.1 hypothetical protein C922_03600 [Plasmodium inui San Antonio 1]